MARRTSNSPEANKQRALREANVEAHCKSRRDWHAANLEKSRAIKRDWYHRNKEKLKPLYNLRDKRKREADGRFTPEDVDRIKLLQRGRCAICRTQLGDKFHRDHIVPLKLGGTNFPSNIQLLCPPCNIGKGAKDPVDHMRSLGMLI